MTREDWTEYVQRITEGVPRSVIAEAAGVHVSGLSRWLNSGVRPRAEKVVDFARGLKQPPVEALIAAGYLDPEDRDGVIEIHQSLKDLSDERLISELTARLAERPSSSKAVDGISLRLAPPHDGGEDCEDS